MEDNQITRLKKLFALYKADPNIRKVHEELRNVRSPFLYSRDFRDIDIFRHLRALGITRMSISADFPITRVYIETLYNNSLTFYLEKEKRGFYRKSLHITTAKVAEGPPRQGLLEKEPIPNYVIDERYEHLPLFDDQRTRSPEEFLHLLFQYYHHYFIDDKNERRRQRIAIAETTDKAILDLRKKNNETPIYDNIAIRKILDYAGLPAGKIPILPGQGDGERESKRQKR